MKLEYKIYIGNRSTTNTNKGKTYYKAPSGFVVRNNNGIGNLYGYSYEEIIEMLLDGYIIEGLDIIEESGRTHILVNEDLGDSHKDFYNEDEHYYLDNEKIYLSDSIFDKLQN